MGMAFEATGTQTERVYDADGAQFGQTESPFALTFVMRQVFGDDRWFIVGVLPAE
jgi:hypothetical protein